MAQKIAPPALRLTAYRHFDSCWYAQYTYTQVLHNQIELHRYIKNIFQNVGTKTAVCHSQIMPYRTILHSYFCDPRRFDEKISKKTPLHYFSSLMHTKLLPLTSLHTPHFLTQAFCHSWTQRQRSWNTMNAPFLWLFFEAMHSENYSLKKISLGRLWNGIPLLLELQSLKKLTTSFEPILKKNQIICSGNVHAFATHVESIHLLKTATQLAWFPKKLGRITKSAQLLAAWIAYQLERRIPFRKILKQATKMVSQQKFVQGFRVVCAGRLSGAEMAQVETKHVGQRPCHTFSARLDYGTAQAMTRKGVFGVKVWLTFQRPNTSVKILPRKLKKKG